MLKSIKNRSEDEQDSQLFTKRNFHVVSLRKESRDMIFKHHRERPQIRINKADQSYKSLQERLDSKFSQHKFHQLGLPHFVALLKSIEIGEQIEGLIGLRLLFWEQTGQKQQLSRKQIINELFLLATASQHAQVEAEAAWTLALISSQPGKPEIGGYLLDLGFTPWIARHLRTDNVAFLEQLIWLVGHLASDFPHHRQKLLEVGIADQLIGLLEQYRASELLTRYTAWALSTLCRGNPRPDYDSIQGVVAVLCWILAEGRIQDEPTFVDCCWAISYYCDPNKGQAECVIESKLYEKLVQLLAVQTGVSTIAPCIRIIDSLLHGDDGIAEKLVSAGLLEGLSNVLLSQLKSMRVRACISIQNAIIRKEEWVRKLSAMAPIERLRAMVQDDCEEASVAAGAILCIMCSCSDLDFDIRLVEMGILPHFQKLIDSSEDKIAVEAISALKIALVFSAEKAEQRGGNNLLALEMLKCGLVETVKRKLLHPNSKVYKAAADLLGHYLPVTEELPQEAQSVLLPEEEFEIRQASIEEIGDRFD